MPLVEEIDACQNCENTLGFDRLKTNNKPYGFFRVDKNESNKVDVLFIAESPPWDRLGNQPYFYNNAYLAKSGLRREVLRHLGLESLDDFKSCSLSTLRRRYPTA